MMKSRSKGSLISESRKNRSDTWTWKSLLNRRPSQRPREERTAQRTRSLRESKPFLKLSPSPWGRRKETIQGKGRGTKSQESLVKLFFLLQSSSKKRWDVNWILQREGTERRKMVTTIRQYQNESWSQVSSISAAFHSFRRKDPLSVY